MRYGSVAVQVMVSSRTLELSSILAALVHFIPPVDLGPAATVNDVWIDEKVRDEECCAMKLRQNLKSEVVERSPASNCGKAERPLFP